jgi:TrmH family RNA methyltransferase
MTTPDFVVSSLQNSRVKQVVTYRKRAARDAENRLLIEGIRECRRALDNRHPVLTLWYCRELFRDQEAEALLAHARDAGAELMPCTAPVFRKMAYREHPDGLLAIAPQIRLTLADLAIGACPLLLVAESIEKPGNLGAILRSADAAGADAVLVCDPATDINNPNTVRASIGTLFSLPVVRSTTTEAAKWLQSHHIQTVAATPHADREYTAIDFRLPTAIVVGAEHAGLSSPWITPTHLPVRIPMLGQADSLNVANAATILLYEAVRQRRSDQRSVIGDQ